MRSVIILRAEAEAEFKEAFHWYEKQAPGLGGDFLFCVDACLAAIQRNPEASPKVHKNIRRAIVRRFPFGVYYLLDENRIVVLAIFHAKRNPKHWQTRTT